MRTSSLLERTAKADATIAPLTIAATPYDWRDPADIPLRPWVYGRWLLRGTVTAVVAPGGIGKSTYLSATALALVTARDLLGKTTWGDRKRVWIWNLEDDLDELARSIQAAAKHFGLCASDIGENLFVDSAMEGTGLCTAIIGESGFEIKAPVFAAITAELIRREIDVLIIDPFVSSHEIEENDNSKIDKIAKAWGRVAKAANCAIVLVHHTSKAGAAEVTALSARGAVALVNACRSALVLNRMTLDEAQKLGIDGAERRRYFNVQDDKHNRAPAEVADWYRLASVNLCNGGHTLGDNIGVAEPWIVPDPFEDVSVDHLIRVQRKVAEGSYKAHHTAVDWAGLAVAEVFGLDVAIKPDKARIMAMLKEWQANGMFKLEERLDKNRQWKKFLAVDRWANDASATPVKGVASRDIAVEQPSATLHPPPVRGGGVAAAAGSSDQVSQPGGIDDPNDGGFEGFDHPPVGGLRKAV
ncbi:AAA family ATPase [Sphingomonas solaris]|uniref:AAA family ATPase n=1 Tax=Alterirhizorhabdus solaris TaxID=2529389 RepID=A0A558R9G9_9SPHN|nr:AAA family ATPase [Sphingomonas solaris]TVV76030.1 AAA family ATPase [Sphingomonas solaris]